MCGGGKGEIGRGRDRGRGRELNVILVNEHGKSQPSIKPLNASKFHCDAQTLEGGQGVLL